MSCSSQVDCVGRLIAVAVLLGAAGTSSAQDAAQVAVREGLARVAYVTAVDAKGVAAADLKPEEVVVKEDGTSRNVLDVRPATDRSGQRHPDASGRDRLRTARSAFRNSLQNSRTANREPANREPTNREPTNREPA